jgi:hypothetical protein
MTDDDRLLVEVAPGFVKPVEDCDLDELDAARELAAIRGTRNAAALDAC